MRQCRRWAGESIPYDRHLAEELRDAFKGRRGIHQRAMFGGLCWMLNGNMLCGVEVGRFLFRVGKPREVEAFKRPGVEAVVFSGRKMGGFVWVDADAALETGLQDWINFAAEFVNSLPPK